MAGVSYAYLLAVALAFLLVLAVTVQVEACSIPKNKCTEMCSNMALAGVNIARCKSMMCCN